MNKQLVRQNSITGGELFQRRRDNEIEQRRRQDLIRKCTSFNSLSDDDDFSDDGFMADEEDKGTPPPLYRTV